MNNRQWSLARLSLGQQISQHLAREHVSTPVSLQTTSQLAPGISTLERCTTLAAAIASAPRRPDSCLHTCSVWELATLWLELTCLPPPVHPTLLGIFECLALSHHLVTIIPPIEATSRLVLPITGRTDDKCGPKATARSMMRAFRMSPTRCLHLHLQAIAAWS
ncbi:hypothetical protein IG631_01128 [Alternaria alternata]|nr:hypothetical protein IG631_01128 [Alternaria alternata]